MGPFPMDGHIYTSYTESAREHESSHANINNTAVQNTVVIILATGSVSKSITYVHVHHYSEYAHTFYRYMYMCRLYPR